MAEKEEIIAKALDGELGVGNGIPVEFTPEFCKEYEVGKLGRFTFAEGVRKYHAAPRSVNRQASWTVKVDDYIAEVEAMRSGGKYDFSRAAAVPEYKEVYTESGVAHAYEPAVLQHVFNLSKDVTLINPSIGCMWRVPADKRTINITFTGDQEVAIAEITAIAKKRSLRISFNEPRGLCYLGTNGARSVPRDKEWIALLPNPFVTEFPYEEYSIHDTEEGIWMTYMRKMRRVRTLLPVNPEFNVYNPLTVDASFCHSKSSHHIGYFLFSSIPLDIRSVDMVSDPIFFFDTVVEMVDGVARKDGVVYDVAGGGTFLSRRNVVVKYAEEHGLNVAPLSDSGRFGVGYMSVQPKETDVVHYDVRGSTICSMGCDLILTSDPTSADFTTGATALIYSPAFPGPCRLFPRGGVISVPADLKERKVLYNPTRDSLYFVFEKVKDVPVFQISVLHRCFAATIRLPAKDYSHYDYPVVDLTSRCLVVFQALARDKVVGEHAITVAQLANALNVTQAAARSAVRRTDQIMCVNGRRPWTEAFALFSYQDEKFVIDEVEHTFYEVWEIWLRKRRIFVGTVADDDRLSMLFALNGVPVVQRVHTAMRVQLRALLPRQFVSSVRVPPKVEIVREDLA